MTLATVDKENLQEAIAASGMPVADIERHAEVSAGTIAYIFACEKIWIGVLGRIAKVLNVKTVNLIKSVEVGRAVTIK